MDINGTSNRAAPPNVSAAIQGAARATGTSFEYLLATAQVESGFNPQAASTTSSARGLYQIIDQTWLATLKRSGAGLGYGKYADAIVETSPGHFEVPDPAARRTIMALRDDPAVNAGVAGALTQDNAAQLAGRLGRKASDGELYIAHFLGPAGAAKLTDLAGTIPTAAADILFPAAAEANRSIFYDRQGHARTVAEVYGTLVGRYDSARYAGKAIAGAATGAITPTALAMMAPTAGAAPSAGSILAAAAPAASRGPPAPLFQGMFSDRSDPVSPVVRDLWTQPPDTAPGGGPPGPAAVPAPVGTAVVSPSIGNTQVSGAPVSPRELFQTQATNASALFGR